ncbi:alanyl (membrane) aminopeptidase-like b [Conger conger]|uniref:alanyl (membrane) aminopeptidase-like b n=1 Tax=Conger conger TaxID=82655 RepID=UPI002A59F013|nr:alanyl (membrane) aminopeptidase-like b [Conger conger]
MSKGIFISKVLAVSISVVTVSAVASVVAMITIFQIQVENKPPVRPPTPPVTTPETTGPPPNMRLPKDLVPFDYSVFLQPYLYGEVTNITNQTFEQNIGFSGESTVKFKCEKATSRIFVHSKDLNVTFMQVTDVNGSNIPIKEHMFHEDGSNFLEIVLSKRMKTSSIYQLHTKFKGEMRDDLSGIYVSQYQENVDEKRFMVASQMQPTDARKVFPCFDEPAMKAVFRITIRHRKPSIALSNSEARGSPSVEEIDGETWYKTEFFPTKIMSTYLLAFIVCDFVPKETSSLRTTVSTYARPEAILAGHADYAQSITGDILSVYEELFGIPYPLSKLGQIALPDFAAGAMENWGLITYRETALLYEEGISSTFNKQWIATVISHELAHQWFGNLVTMKWWNDLWLNEGFATYISYLGVDKVNSSWNAKDLMVLNDIQSVFQVDALATSHPLSSKEQDIRTPADISQLFDSITYSKGAAVLRMLSDYISDSVFKEGLRSYLNAYKYSNADYKDLWKHLQEAVVANQGRQEVEAVMNTWTEQMGYPVLTVDTISGNISQQHFLLNQTSDYNYLWLIPIKVMKAGGKVRDELMRKGSDSKSAFIAEKDEWVLANVNCTGYFRVNYNQENWQRLLQQLNNTHSEIPVINRGQLIDDAFNLARAKYINITLALNTTKYLSNDTEYIPWESALRNLEFFILMFDRSEVYGPMKAYLRKQVSPLYNYFENYTLSLTVPDSHQEQHNQINAITVACSNGLPKCTEMVKSVFTNWIDDPVNNTIHPNLKSTIYCNGIAMTGEKEWDIVWQRYQDASIATEKDKLRYALSCSKDIWVLSRYLSYTLDAVKIRKMDAVSTINYIARNVAGQSLAWDFVQSQWSYISEDYGGGIMSLGSLIEGVTQRFSTEFELQQLKQFQKDHTADSLSSGIRALQQAIERTQANIKWVKENKPIVLDWFRGQAAESQGF